MPLCSPTNKPATHSGVYDPIANPAVQGLTLGKRYDLIHDNASYTCILINDHGSYFVCDAQDFSTIICLDDRDAPDDLTWEEDDDAPKKKKFFGKKQRQDDLGVPPDPCPVDPSIDWDEDEANDAFANLDPADYLAPGIQVIARDVEPVPNGPKSTDELRKYRFKPDTF